MKTSDSEVAGLLLERIGRLCKSLTLKGFWNTITPLTFQVAVSSLCNSSFCSCISAKYSTAAEWVHSDRSRKQNPLERSYSICRHFWTQQISPTSWAEVEYKDYKTDGTGQGVWEICFNRRSVKYVIKQKINIVKTELSHNSKVILE